MIHIRIDLKRYPTDQDPDSRARFFIIKIKGKIFLTFFETFFFMNCYKDLEKDSQAHVKTIRLILKD